jgi:flavin-dependent dehydrogenase
MKDIKILGAGLSGLTAAINLVRSGYRVDVYERNRDAGVRFHGDLQGLENWSEKTDVLKELKLMNIGLDFECHPFSKVILTNCSKTREISSKRPMFYLVKRGSFSGTIDHSMKLQALKAGVNIHFQRTLLPTEADVVATGPFPKEIVGLVRGIAFRTSLKDVAILTLNDRLAFKGYSYLLVTKGYGCMCAVVRRDEMSRANEYFERTKEFFVKQLNLDTQPSKQVGGVGSFSLKNVREGNILYTGEAAGLQDFWWGFGMRYAITSGYLAAQSIISNGDYEKTVKNHFGNKLKAGVVNRYLMEYVLCKKDYSIFMGMAEVLNKNLYSMHRYNALQRAVYPLAMLCLQKTYPKLKP